MKRENGFTLMELLIVVAIIAIIAALALPAYQDYVIRAQVSEGLSMASGARAAVWEYAANHGKLPPDNAAAGVAAMEDLQGAYVSEVKVLPAGIQMTYGNKASRAIQGGTVLLAPTLSSMSGTVDWTCTGGTLSAKYRPTICR